MKRGERREERGEEREERNESRSETERRMKSRSSSRYSYCLRSVCVSILCPNVATREGRSLCYCVTSFLVYLALVVAASLLARLSLLLYCIPQSLRDDVFVITQRRRRKLDLVALRRPRRSLRTRSKIVRE